MRVFWLNHGLHIDPENQDEADTLARLVRSIRFVTKGAAAAEQDLSVQPGAKIGIADHQIIP